VEVRFEIHIFSTYLGLALG